MTTQPKKILIVEDEAPLLHALVDKFTHEGFTVLEAKNGEEGLGLALKEHPDLILLDIIMPIMDGMTMFKRLQEDDRGKDIPVIMLSNLSDFDSIAEATQSGMLHSYLIKTHWKIEDVVKKVKEKLEVS